MRVVVTGGGGFVGKALCYALLNRGYKITSISRKTYSELEKRGIKCVTADLSKDKKQILNALDGASVVFHIAAKVEMWGKYEDFYQANVIATENIIDCSKKCSVQRLIYCSSPSVVADGNNLCGINESYPYPKKFETYYSKTKALAEQAVLAANSDLLWTIALRPHLIWGEGDNNLVPTIINRAKQGRLFQIGDGLNKIDVTYIDDCIQAHIAAFCALESNPKCRGKAYFISQGEPVNMWAWINDILVRNKLPPISKKLPKSLGMFIASLSELAHNILPWHPEPLLTKFLLSEMTTSHYFDISNAKKELGYNPKWTVKEAMDRVFGK